MLVNIYGSKDLFVSEYRTLLADRILSSFNYDTEKEVSTHENYSRKPVRPANLATFHFQELSSFARASHIFLVSLDVYF